VAILNLAQTEFTMKEGKLLILFIYFCPEVATSFGEWNRCVNVTGQRIEI
jgi:hypothetical protein